MSCKLKGFLDGQAAAAMVVGWSAAAATCRCSQSCVRTYGRHRLSENAMRRRQRPLASATVMAGAANMEEGAVGAPATGCS